MQAGESAPVAIVDITGVIGWDDSQSIEFGDKLKGAVDSGAASIVLRVNSPGGNVFSALSMYDSIKACKVPVRAEVYGFAASAATLLVMAADIIAMSESSKFMVHQPQAGVWGDPDEIMNYATMLIKERERMFGIYGARCGKPWDQVSNDHKNSVYYSAEEAIAYGFVDEIIKDPTEKTPDDPAPEENEKEDEDAAAQPATAKGMTGMKQQLEREVKSLFGRVFGLNQSPQNTASEPDPVEPLKTKIAELESTNSGLTAQLSKLKTGNENNCNLIKQLVDKQVTARMAALGINAEDLPSATEDEVGTVNPLPTSKEEFSALPVDLRIAAIQQSPEEMKKFI